MTSLDKIFRIKPTNIFLELLKESKETKSMTYLSKKVDLNYNYITLILKDYIKDDLVTQTKSGRMKIISLTKRGLFIAKRIRDISDILPLLK